jgi:hypothetical protein
METNYRKDTLRTAKIRKGVSTSEHCLKEERASMNNVEALLACTEL